VITLRIDFGGDNHADREFVKETDETVEGVGHLQTLVETVDGMRAEGAFGERGSTRRSPVVRSSRWLSRNENRHHAQICVIETMGEHKPGQIEGARQR
jgi:hypothetical protein